MLWLIAALQATGTAVDSGPRFDPLVIFFAAGIIGTIVVLVILLRGDPDPRKGLRGTGPGPEAGEQGGEKKDVRPPGAGE